MLFGFTFTGRNFTALVIYTRLLSMPAPLKSASSCLPALPTNGRPCFASSPPGASPISITSGFTGPSPNTGWE